MCLAESAIPSTISCALQRRGNALWMRLAGLIALLALLFSPPARAAEHYDLLPGSDLATPVYVRDSGRTGPTVLIVAAIHGDEVAGHHAAEALRRETPARGRWIIVPTAHRRAFTAGLRTTYDMPDLNRSFPGSAHGAASARLADALLGLVARYRPVLVLDLHEALPVRDGVANELANSLIISESQGTGTAGASGLSAAELALDLSEGPPLPGGQTLTLLAGAPAGSFNRVASERYAVPVITVESNRGEALSARIDYHRTIVRRLLEAIGGAPR